MLKDIYNQRITILNKLRRTDTKSGMLDEWYKYTVDNAAWYTDSARSAGGSSVFIGTYIKVYIPFNEAYLPYLEWRDGDKVSHFTMSTNDYVILGDVPETITAANIVKTLEKYGENVCQVKHHKANYDRFGAFVQLKVEGV